MDNYRPNASKIAKKRFGQNFLEDRSVIEKIIQSMPDDDLPIVEIGPGLGDLTKELVRVRPVTAFEVDSRLCDYLEESFSKEIAEGRLRLECGDVMQRWEDKSLISHPYKLVANLPYYIATKILLKALSDPNCRFILTMVQREVAEKFSSHEGERSFCALSVLTRSIAEVRISLLVPPQAFNPPPKVESAVLEIRKKSSRRDEGFENFLKVALRQPRKTLMKNLSASYARSRLDHLFDDLGVEKTLRPHQVGTSLYHRLYKELTKDSDHEQAAKSILTRAE